MRLNMMQTLGLTEEQKRRLAYFDGCPFEGKGMAWLVFPDVVFRTIEEVEEKDRKEVMVLGVGCCYRTEDRSYIRTM